jgi:hypothetical protein
MRGIVNPSPTPPSKKPSGKKPYKEPVLQSYGDIGMLTVATAMGMVSDSGVKMGFKMTV